MSRCDSVVSAITTGVQFLDSTTEVALTVLRDLSSCTRFNFRDSTALDGRVGFFNSSMVPPETLRCLPRGCYNSGTFQVTGEPGSDRVGIEKAVRADATNFAVGIFNFKVLNDSQHPEFTIEFQITDFNDTDFSNSNTYRLHYSHLGWQDVTVNLFELPDEMSGTGWLPSRAGIRFRVHFLPSGGVTPRLSISSADVFDTIADFRIEDTIILSCLDSIDGTDTPGMSESTCFGNRYNHNETEVTRTINFQSHAGNYNALNILLDEPEEIDGFEFVSTSVTAEHVSIGGVDYGHILIHDYFDDQCGFAFLQLNENCAARDSVLSRINVDTPLSLDLSDFQLIDGARVSDNYAGSKIILVNQNLIGQDMILKYPALRNTRTSLATGNMSNNLRVMMTYTKEFNDGKKYQILYEDLRITSLPLGIQSEEGALALELTAERTNGHWYKVMEILN